MTTLRLTPASVTNNSLSKDYPHPDDHAKQINKINNNNKSEVLDDTKKFVVLQWNFSETARYSWYSWRIA